MIWIIQKLEERGSLKDYRDTEHHKLFTLTPKKNTNDILMLLNKQDLKGPHNSGPRYHFGEKHIG